MKWYLLHRKPAIYFTTDEIKIAFSPSFSWLVVKKDSFFKDFSSKKADCKKNDGFQG